MKIALLTLLLLSLCMYADTVYQRIENDQELTVDQKALYFVYSVLAQDKLPLEYTVDASSGRSGTPALHEATLLLDRVSSATLNEIVDLAQRPSLSGSPLSFVTTGGHFKMHYTLTGNDACTLAYAQSIGNYMDYAWAEECGRMGFFTPPPDHLVGGDDLYDVYVAHLNGGTLGYTTSSGEYKPPDSTHSCSASHIVMGNSLGEDHQKVTTAHEFQHAIQMSYDYQEPTWFMENCAVWVEDQIWDDINDYLGYFSVGAIRKPYKSITSGSMYWYGASYWPRMMGLMNGYQAVREVWENCAATAGNNMLSAQNEMFAAHGSSFENGFMQYGLWRYMVGPQWAASFNLYDEEADTWGTPLVLPWNRVNTLPYSGNQGSNPSYLIDVYGIAWIKVKLENYQDGWVQIDFNGRDGFEWDLGAIIFNDNNVQFEWFNCDPSTGEKTVAVPTKGWDYAIFFPALINRNSLTPKYTFDISYTTGIEEEETVSDLGLDVVSNPMTTGSAVNFNLPSSGYADLSVVDMAGRRVSTLFSAETESGFHTADFQGGLSSGTYFVVLRHENSIETARVSILR
jgi:hypothetical protein